MDEMKDEPEQRKQESARRRMRDCVDQLHWKRSSASFVDLPSLLSPSVSTMASPCDGVIRDQLKLATDERKLGWPSRDAFLGDQFPGRLRARVGARIRARARARAGSRRSLSALNPCGCVGRGDAADSRQGPASERVERREARGRASERARERRPPRRKPCCCRQSSGYPSARRGKCSTV